MERFCQWTDTCKFYLDKSSGFFYIKTIAFTSLLLISDCFTTYNKTEAEKLWKFFRFLV